MNLAATLLADAGADPGRLVSVGDSGPVGLRDLGDRSRIVSAVLAAHGVRAGDVVALALPDRPAWIAAFLGIARIGAIAALVGEGMGADRARDLITRAGARMLITERDDLTCDQTLGMRDLREAGSASDPGVRDMSHGDPLYLLATSGSTGASKWAVHVHGDIPSCIATYGRRVLRMGPGDVTWSVAALATSYGLGNSLYFPIGAGAAAWLGGERDPAGAAHACQEGGVNAMFGVPTFWARLARHVAEGRVPADAFAAVHLAVSAGEHLPEAVWRAVEATTGMRLVNGLGSSEATNLYLSDRRGSPGPGRVGWPVPGYDVRIAGSERPAVGDEGELLVRGPTVMRGYLDDPVATGKALENGWLHTGDVVQLEPDGGYRFVGRNGDVFKAGALWVDPLKVQAVLLDDPDVYDAVVLGAEDPDGVTRLVAVVAAQPTPDLEGRLMAACHDRLEHHLVPRLIRATDTLPATPSGKVRRDAIREMATSALSDRGVA
jgi:fatty-acyl-CoA synthase/benzoate-CoA ligase/fatty acid CoA ligase FadD22